jgi:pimeloyl-ACP methyl ester carboxylesterase
MWLEAVLAGLGLEKTAIVGMSLGGWFGLRYATRFPDRVTAIACLVPGGIAPQRSDFLPKVIWYSLQGKRGAEKIKQLVNHKVVLPTEALEFGNLVQKYFKPLTEVLPVFSDEEIRRLTMPVYYAAGDQDSILDTLASAERLRQLLPHATVKVLEDVGHLVLDRGPEIDMFLP